MAFAAASLLSRGWLAGGVVGWRNRPSNGGEPQNPRPTSVGGYCTTLAWGDFKSKAYVNSQISFHVWARRKIRESPRSASAGADCGRLSLLTTLSSLLAPSLFSLKIALSQLPRWREKLRKSMFRKRLGRARSLSLLTPLSSLFSLHPALFSLKTARNHALFPLDRRYM